MKIKRIITLASALILALTAVSVLSSCGSQIDDGVLIYEERSNGFGVMGCVDTEATEVVIPSEIDGKPVVAVYGMSFFTKMEKLTIPETVTYFGSEAFSKCVSLKEVRYNATEVIGTTSTHGYFKGAGSSDGMKIVFGANVKNVPSNLLSGCANLTEVVFEGTVCESIGTNAFADCTKLTSIELVGTTAIGDNAFKGCTALTNVVLPETLTVIKSAAFADCTALTEITLPASVTELGGKAFNNCENLTVINFNGSTSDWQNITTATGADFFGTDVGKNNPDFPKYGKRVTVRCTDGEIEFK